MKVSIIIPHFKTWKWTAICIHHFQKFPMPCEHEIIVCDNSPGHPSINAISDTSLGVGVKIVPGEPDFTSHGRGYELAYAASTGDFIFTSETDSFPIKDGWFLPYMHEMAFHDLIGPEIPQASGKYIHPAGAIIRREWVEKTRVWREKYDHWWFCPGAAVRLGTDERPYHVVARAVFLPEFTEDMLVWKRAEAWQEMRIFSDDTFENYGQRVCPPHSTFSPEKDRQWYNKIGYEAGQWLSYFVESSGGSVKRADTQMHWMPGHEGKQAARVEIMGGGFQHVFGGTVVTVSAENMPRDVVAFKNQQMDTFWQQLPERLRRQIEAMEKHYEPAAKN